MGRAAFRKKGVNGALRSWNWGHLGWRRDHFRGSGKLESEVQLCLTTRERLEPENCLAALLPKICYMSKLVVGKGMGCGAPRSLRGHGR